jgi:ubiquinone/menaquinone biosynthesis C-methylase UbiE
MGMSASAAEQFNAVADAYATSAVHARGPDLRLLVDSLGTRRDWSVLDLGTGAGHASFAVAPHVSRVTAVDIADRMLEASATQARERGIENITFLRASADCLPFENATFDAAYSRLSAHHWRDPAAGVAEIARVLKPGAPFVLIDSVGFDEPALDTFLNALELLRDPSHARNNPVAQWNATLEQNNCRVEHVERWTIELEIEPWLERSATIGWRASACRRLLAEAPLEARQALSIRDDGRLFCIPSALIAARRTIDPKS